MPIEYTSYGCKYKCGWRHTEDWSNIVVHEDKCWYNPENKTCLTCQYKKEQCEKGIDFTDEDIGQEYKKLKVMCKEYRELPRLQRI